MIYQAISLLDDISSTTLSSYYLDLETTGLCKQKDTILLIGLLEATPSHFIYHRWMSTKETDEIDLITAFHDFLDSSFTFYTYSGTTFDLKFLVARAELYDLDLFKLKTCQHVDIKRYPLWQSIFGTSRPNRQVIEDLTHYHRKTTLKGRELAKLANLYAKKPLKSYGELLQKHNQDDLQSLVHLHYFCKFIYQLPLSKMIDCKIIDTSYAYRYEPTQHLTYSFVFTYAGVQCDYNHLTHHLTLTLPITLGVMRQFVNAKDYYIVNHQLLHHSLARTLPAALRRKAKPQEAYLEKNEAYMTDLSGKSSWVDAHKHPVLTSEEPLAIEEILKCFTKKITQGT